MSKKVICFISSGISLFIMLMYLMTTFMAGEADAKALLLLLVLVFPFLILGLIAGIIIDKKRILAGIFMIISSIATIFIGLMCCAGGMSFLGILALPLSFIALILYIISAIMAFINK